MKAARKAFLIFSLLLLAAAFGLLAAPPARAEGGTEIRLADFSDSLQGTLTLAPGVTFVKETSAGGLSRSGNTFTLPAGLLESSGETKRYCVLSGGTLYFGARGEGSGGNLLVLEEMSTLQPANLTELLQGDEPAYGKLNTVDTEKLKEACARAEAEGRPLSEKQDVFREVTGFYSPLSGYVDEFDVEEPFDVDFHTTIKGVPITLKVSGKARAIFSRDDPGWDSATKNRFHVIIDADVDSLGVSSENPSSGDIADIPIYKIQDCTLVALRLRLDNYQGNMDIGMKVHQGFTVDWESWLIPISIPEFNSDADNSFDSEVRNLEGTGQLKAVIAAGPQAGFGDIASVSAVLEFGLVMDFSGQEPRFHPTDTLEQWHVCDECLHEELSLILGPFRLNMRVFWGLTDIEFHTPEAQSPPFYDFHYSRTFNHFGESFCPYQAFRLNVEVVNQDGDPLKDVVVTYSPIPEHYEPTATATTGADGTAVIYKVPGRTDIVATLTSPSDPSRTVSVRQSHKKETKIEDLRLTLDIPSKHVYFRDTVTGEATDWPEDMAFVPFYSNEVQLPDAVPGKGGRVFTGWNSEPDGSGTAYTPGQALTLEDDLTLYAQWQLATGSWYILYDANGGTSAPGAQIVPLGQDAVLSAELPVMGENRFLGWTPDLTAKAPVYQPGDTLAYNSGVNIVVLRAMWEISPVQRPVLVSFDANGVQGAGLPEDIWLEQNGWMQLESALAPLGSPYIFLGWSEDPASVSPEFIPGRTYHFTRDTVLYAVWTTSEAVTLFFADPLPGGDASGLPEAISILPSMSRNVLIPGRIPQKSGRVFTGWNTERDGSGKNVAPGTLFTLVTDTTLWAQWQLAGDSWYILYDANGGSSAPGAQIVPQGQDAVLSAELPVMESGVFKGWTPDLTAKAPVYQPGDTLAYNSGINIVVLRAMWEISPVQRPVLVSFDANGVQGAVLPEDTWIERRGWMQPEAALAPLGSPYVFLGWSEDPDAVSPEYPAGQACSFDRDTVLYAIWEQADRITLTFRDSLTDDVSGLPEEISILPSMSPNILIPDQIPQKGGRVFTGWNTAQDGSGKNVAPGTLFTLNQNTTLWAQWQLAGDSWYILYDASGGTSAPGAQIVPLGQDAVLSAELPVMESGIFKGWTPDLTAKAPVYQPGDTLAYNSGVNIVVLRAMWEISPVQRPVRVSFDANGVQGAGLPEDAWLRKNGWLQLEAALPPLGSPYVFLGWSEDRASLSPESLAGDTRFFNRDTVLYAIWDKTGVTTLTFKDSLTDAVSNMPESISILPSMSRNVLIPDQIPQKDGRVFTGWNTAQDGSGNNVAPGTLFTLNQNTTLWARWQPADGSWYILYDANGGSSAPGAQTVPQGTDATLSAEPPVRESSVFRGWSLSRNGADPLYQPGDTLKYTAGKTLTVLYASWELDPAERPVVLTFDANGGQKDSAPANRSVPRSVWITLSDPAPSWDPQHDFLGWARKASASAPEWKPGAPAVFEKDTTLYAVWSAHYKVIEGANAVWTRGSDVSQRFAADGNLQYFKELRIDGKTVAGADISSGSTVALINARTMNRLSAGQHTVTFVYRDGEASAAFTVKDVIPKTGDAGNPELWLLMVLLGAAGLDLIHRLLKHSNL